MKYDKAFFHLAFSQQLTENEENSITPVYCGIANRITPQIHKWIATKKALANPIKREQDGMCNGEFKVHVEVFSIDGDRTYSDFIIKVGKEFENLDVTKVDCKCINESKWTRLRNLFRRTK